MKELIGIILLGAMLVLVTGAVIAAMVWFVIYMLRLLNVIP